MNWLSFVLGILAGSLLTFSFFARVYIVNMQNRITVNSDLQELNRRVYTLEKYMPEVAGLLASIQLPDLLP